MIRTLARSALSVAVACTLAAWPRAASAQDLAPPPPMDPNATSNVPTSPMPPSGTATTQTLDAAQREDSGRGLEFFYANAGVAFSALGLRTLSEDKLGLDKASGVGPAFDLGLGVRLLYFTFGPRARYHVFSGFNLWQVNGEGALHLPLGNLDVYFGAHGGYSFTGRVSQDALAANAGVSASDVSVRGVDVGLQMGLDYYLSSLFSIGGELSGEALFLHRGAVSNSTDATFGTSGSGIGAAVLVGSHAGIHF